MARIEAQPDALSGAGARQSELAGRLSELAERLTGASSAACAAGDPDLSGAISDSVLSWQASLALLSQSVGGLATNLTAASGAYTETDAGAIPGS